MVQIDIWANGRTDRRMPNIVKIFNNCKKNKNMSSLMERWANNFCFSFYFFKSLDAFALRKSLTHRAKNFMSKKITNAQN